MWQDLYPQKWVPPSSTSDDGEITVKPTDQLVPFHKDANGAAWDSNDTRYQARFGYTYPDLQRWLDIYKTNGQFDLAKYQKALRASIELKYSVTGKATLKLPENDQLATALISKLTPQNLTVENFPASLQAKAQQIFADRPPQPPAPPAAQQSAQQVLTGHTPAPLQKTLCWGVDQLAKLAPPNAVKEERWEENDYVVNFLYDRFALGGYPYSIRIFLGDVPEGPTFYSADTPTQVGLVYNFSGPADIRGTGPAGCDNCLRQQEHRELSTGQVILTDHLIAYIRQETTARGLTLTTLHRDEVVDYLKKNLHWRVTDTSDVLVPNEEVRSLKISVAMGRATHFAEASSFSRYPDYEVLWDVTDGRLAGAVPGGLGLGR